jgi:pilus assembly protein FimV
MPSAATAEFESATQASQIVVAQSLDFNDYRRKLAAASPQSAVLNADRKASGTLQTKVEDKKQTSPSPDKLTLSKGGVKGVTPEAQIATELAAKDSAERAAEIAKNISDLSKLNVTTKVEAPPPVPAPSAPASATLAPTLAVEPLPKVSAATAAAAPKIAASAPQKSSPGWLEGLINNPYTPLGAVGLMAALAGFGVYRHKKRIKVQSSLFADQLSPQTPGESPEASRFSAAPTEPEHPLTPAPGLDLPDDELTARAYVKDLAMDLDLNLDLDLEPDEPSQPIKPAPTKHPEPATLAQSIDLALPDLDIFTAPEVGKAVIRVADLKPRPPPPSKAPIAPSAPDLSTLDFDIGALSLDLDDASDDDKPTASGDSQDPLETKLALAHEFSAIGDEYGARALIEEVIAEATGTMKTKAERALSQLQGS